MEGYFRLSATMNSINFDIKILVAGLEILDSLLVVDFEHYSIISVDPREKVKADYSVNIFPKLLVEGN